MSGIKKIEIRDGLLNMDDASSFLGIKKSTLYDLTMRRKITYVKVGKLNKFALSDLQDYIAKNRVEATEPHTLN